MPRLQDYMHNQLIKDCKQKKYVNLFNEYNKIRAQILTHIHAQVKLDNNLKSVRRNDYRIVKLLNETYITCPWCYCEIKFRDKSHVRKHYIKN